MKKLYLVLFIFCAGTITVAQTDTVIAYKKTSVMIPMRDGVKLFTVILAPADAKKPVPILIQRTPYGANIPIPDDTTIKTATARPKLYLSQGRIHICLPGHPRKI